MTEPFLITGLPRSRTAWMAVAATNASSICYHEPISTMPKWEDVFDLWSASPWPYTGISDSSLGFHLEKILAEIKPRTLVIERPVDEVESSLERILPAMSNYTALLVEYLTPFLDHPLVRRVPYAALEDSETVVECLRYLMPHADVSLVKIAELQRLNIQTDMERTIRMAVERSAQERAAQLGPSVVKLLRARP